MKLRRIMTGMVASCLTAATLAIAASAVEPSYKVSEEYKDTLYYDNLQAVELTGDGATDVIAVALSQLYYHEGNRESEKDGLNGSGSKNFVEYNVLFGKLDNGEGNGYSYGYAWCAAFVNWCLRQARVDMDLTGGMFVSCHAWRSWFVNEGAKFGASYHDRTDDYIPQKGDLIFYKSLSATHSRSSDHIGIVLKCEGGKVYAIEGNGDNRVALHEYALDSRYIVGYGTVAYETADVPEVDYYRTEDHLPGFFIAGSGALAAYNGPDTATGKVTNLTPNAVYRITAVEGKYGRVSLEDGTHVWVSLKRFTPMTTDEYVTVEMVHGEQIYRARVAKGTEWRLPASEVLAKTFGEIGNLVCWGSGNGVMLSAGESFVPETDVTLLAVLESPTETEAESETDPAPESETEQESREQASDAPVTDGETAEDTSDPAAAEPVSEGCSGTLSAAVLVMLLSAGLALTFRKKKR